MPIAIYHDNIMPHQKIKKDTFITLLKMGIPSKLDLMYLAKFVPTTNFKYIFPIVCVDWNVQLSLNYIFFEILPMIVIP